MKLMVLSILHSDGAALQNATNAQYLRDNFGFMDISIFWHFYHIKLKRSSQMPTIEIVHHNSFVYISYVKFLIN